VAGTASTAGDVRRDRSPDTVGLTRSVDHDENARDLPRGATVGYFGDYEV
jgi:hypothetical protein